MKISRFNENNDNESDSDWVFNNYNDINMDDLVNRIEETSKGSTVENDYKGLKFGRFFKENNLTKCVKFFNDKDEIQFLEDKIDTDKKTLEKTQLIAEYELLFKFQEDLLNKDENKFFEEYLDDALFDHNGGDEVWGKSGPYRDIVPKLLKKYKSKIDLLIKTHNLNM